MPPSGSFTRQAQDVVTRPSILTFPLLIVLATLFLVPVHEEAMGRVALYAGLSRADLLPLM